MSDNPLDELAEADPPGLDDVFQELEPTDEQLERIVRRARIDRAKWLVKEREKER